MFRPIKGPFLGHVKTLDISEACIYLRCGVDGKLQLGLLAIIHRETLHQQGGEPGPGASTEGVEDEESLEPSALVSQLPDSVEDQVHDLLTDGVVAPEEIQVFTNSTQVNDIFGMQSVLTNQRSALGSCDLS